MVKVDVEALLVACPSEVTDVEVVAVLVACTSEVTEVEVEAVLVAYPSEEVTVVTAVELMGGGGSVTAPVGAAVAVAKPSGNRREWEARGLSTFSEVFSGIGGKEWARENSPTASVRMLSAEGISVSHLFS